jgi:hypothetical protein
MLDRFGELVTLGAQAKPFLEERDFLKARIRDHRVLLPGAKGARIEGSSHFVDIGLKENARTVTDLGKVFAGPKKAVGLEKLAKARSYTINPIDEHLPTAEQAKLIQPERTDARDVTFSTPYATNDEKLRSHEFRRPRFRAQWLPRQAYPPLLRRSGRRNEAMLEVPLVTFSEDAVLDQGNCYGKAQ